jgi:hypothetical protein
MELSYNEKSITSKHNRIENHNIQKKKITIYTIGMSAFIIFFKIHIIQL